jgi:hypothetical protein
MEPVVAQFVENPGGNQEAAGHSNGQAGNVDQGIPGLPPNAPEYHFDIVSQHDILAFLFLCKTYANFVSGEGDLPDKEKMGG